MASSHKPENPGADASPVVTRVMTPATDLPESSQLATGGPADNKATNKDPEQTRVDFIELLAASLENHSWVRLVLSKYRGPDKTLERISIRPVNLREEAMLSFVYEHKTNHITKNLKAIDALIKITDLLEADFKSASFFAVGSETQLDISKKGKISIRSRAARHKLDDKVADAAAAVTAAQEAQAHNREKRRFVDLQRPYLTALGVTDQQQQLIPAMSRKWKQINKFIEIFSQALASSPLAVTPEATASKPLQVVDFGSGKGYLTFAIHDYLRHQCQNPAQVTGVELRENLATLCNNAAATLDHAGLNFVCGDVKTHAPAHTDVMIALHACDVATDYAIHYGIRAQASIIMCSPCCHKQIRPQMHSPTMLKPMLQYGVHLGQEAEMVTDALRALLLEASGYTTKVFEFISLEHTNKNKMILAVKKTNPGSNRDLLDQIKSLKAFYGIEEHCLETLLEQSAAEMV